jgi:Lrp/AsnC family leucine-responsive transcriptional regulator
MVDLDDTDKHLLVLLQQDARLGFRELSRKVGMSPPAVASRVRRLEDTGVITGYSARVDPAKAGFDVQAFVMVTTAGRRQSYDLGRLSQSQPTVIEDHRITGSDDHLIKLIAPRLGDLEPVIDEFNSFGTSTTSIMLSSPKPWSPVPLTHQVPD